MLVSLACDGCGIDIQKEHWAVNKTRNFCSLECKWQSEKTTLTCEQCGSSYTMKSSVADSKRRFCSRKCYLEWKRKVGRITLICQQCGKNFSRQKWIPTKSYICCSRKCLADYQKKDRVVNPSGYIWIWVNDQKVLEHRFVMEQYLGRELARTEHIHHINGNQTDNRVENLQLVTPSEHTKIHWTGRKHTPESRKKMSIGVRQAYADPIKGKRMRDALSARNRARSKNTSSDSFHT